METRVNSLSDIADEIQRQIDKKGDNSDPERLMLIVLRAIYDRVGSIEKKFDLLEKNPSIEFGSFVQTHPRLAWVFLVIAWVMTGAVAAMAIIGAVKSMGLTIVGNP